MYNCLLFIIIGMAIVVAVAESRKSNRFKVDQIVCVKENVNVRTSPCGSLLTRTSGVTRGRVKSVVQQSCLGGEYTWVNMQLLSRENLTVWIANVGEYSIYPCEVLEQLPDFIDHPVPFVNQNLDTPNEHCGWYSCGPTSAVMTLAYFGRLEKRTIFITKPENDTHTNDYGYYVSTSYTAPDGFVFGKSQPDPCNRPAMGAYGHCIQDQLAWAWRIQDYLKHHYVHSQFYEKATLDQVKNALASGRLIILSTKLTGGGHIIVVKGYHGDQQQNKIIVNDPYGCKVLGNYGKLRNGQDCVYEWDYVHAKWMIEVWA